MNNTDIWILLVLFQIKHFLADFPLQGKYMLGKFKSGLDWIYPLTAHCLVHVILTATIIIWYTLYAKSGRMPIEWFWLPIVDFVVHFAQDRLKASPNLMGRWKPDNKFFWWALGQDQMVHHLTHYVIIWSLLK